MSKFIPQFNSLTFSTKEEFRAWRKETTKWIVKFEDDGQDLLIFYVAENFEIIDVVLPHLANIYNGAFVTNGEPEELGMLKIYNTKFGEESYIKYQILSVEKCK